jgi:hypothetical protein
MTDIPEQLDSLLEIPVELGEGSRQIRLRVPPVVEVLPSLPDLERAGTREEYRRALRLEILAIVDSIDGREAAFAEIDEIVDSAPALRAVLEARNAVYSSLLQAGRFWCACPRCGAEVDYDVGTYAVLGLRLADLPPIVTPTFPVIPRIGSLLPSGERPSDVPRSRPIRFELPSAKADLDIPHTGGALGDLDPSSPRIAAAWERWAPTGVDQPLGRNYWRRGNLGFQAILNLCLALERLDGATKIDPEVIEEMLIPDFYFLDIVYYLTHNVDIPADSGLVAACQSCGLVYLRAR